MRRWLGQPQLLSLGVFALFIIVWQLLTAADPANNIAVDPEYARLAGASAAATPSAAIPTPGAVAKRGWELLTKAFDDSNPNSLGIAWHLLRSMGRVLLGFGLAVVVAACWLHARIISVSLPDRQPVHSGATAHLAARLDAAGSTCSATPASPPRLNLTNRKSFEREWCGPRSSRPVHRQLSFELSRQWCQTLQRPTDPTAPIRDRNFSEETGRPAIRSVPIPVLAH
jgi:hypothetical protein